MNARELLRSIPDLNKILSNVPERLIDHMTVKTLPLGVTLIKKDEEVVNVYILCKGKLGIINQFTSGDIYFFAEQSAISFSGEVEAISGNNFYACQNKTLTECTFIVINKEVFKEIFETNIEFSNYLAKTIALKIYPRSYSSGHNIIYPLMYNFIVYLLNHASKNNKESNIIVNETRQVIADRLGVNVRSINRKVKEMKEMGLINVSKGKIIISKEQLNKLKIELHKYE